MRLLLLVLLLQLNDDTADMQAILDSKEPLVLKQGTYNVTNLKTKMGSMIVGNGATIRGNILIATEAGHGYAISGSITDLNIRGSIKVDPSVKNISAWRLENIGGTAPEGGYLVDLTGAYSQDMTIRNIKSRNNGSGAVKILGNANVIDQVNTEGDDQLSKKTVNGRLHVEGAGNHISNCIIESGSVAMVSYYIKGSFTWVSNWEEAFGDSRVTGIPHYVFEDAWADIDELKLFDYARFVKLINSPNIRIRHLDARSADLDKVMIMDDKSNVVVGLVTKQRDCNWLDNPRFQIDRVYNEFDGVILTNPPKTRSDELLKNPEIKDLVEGGISKTRRYWTIQDKNGLKYKAPKVSREIDGTTTLSIEVTANPNAQNLVVVVEASPIEGKVIVQLTGNVQWMIWNDTFSHNFSNRVVGERTMCTGPSSATYYLITNQPKTGQILRINGLSVKKW